MKLIIYTKRCLACTDKPTWKKVKEFAASNGFSIEERRINLKKEWQEQAESYGVSLPFAVSGKIALSLTEDLEILL